MRNKQINLVAMSTTLVAALLCVFTLAHGLGMLSGNERQLLAYQNVVSKEPRETISLAIMRAFRLTGIFFALCSILLLIFFAKTAFRKSSNTILLKWALFSAVLAVTLYGGIMRVVSNQQGAALLFFFTMLLYLTIPLVEKKPLQTTTFFESVKLLPLYAVFFYTMALPGWAKIFGGRQVIDRYVNMFKDSFIASLPGGTSPVIYFLGVLELTVPLLLIISLAKREFREPATKTWFNYALVLSIFTFTILCFGLAVLLNFAGSTNLVFYPILTLLILVSFNQPLKLRSIEHN